MLPRLRVLLVEDSDDDAVMLGRLLRAGVGHLVLGQVKTAAELAAALDAGPWDVVLTDYQLPGFDPFDVFAMLRARGLDIPVIIVSGTVGEETAVAAMKAGAHDFFRKDHLARLVPAIERELREAAGRRERRRAEAALRESEARLRLLTDALPVLISYVDAEGRYQFNNQPYEAWFGHPREAIRGRHLREVLGEAAYTALRPHVEAALSGRRVTYEGLVPYKDGGTRHIEASYVPHVDPAGKVLGFYAFVQDVTERKQAERAIRDSEARVQAVARLAPVGLFRTDAQGHCVYVNERWCELTGLTPERARGQGWADALHPEDRKRVFAEWYAAAGQRQEFMSEYRFRRPDGTTCWVVGRAMPELGGDGEVTGYIGAVADVTERRRAEEERERLLHRERAAHAEAQAAEQRATFLAEASRVLAASLDYEATLQSVARLAVPELADWCVVDLADGPARTRRVALAHGDPGGGPLADELRRVSFSPEAPHPIPRAMRTGRAELIPEVTAAWLDEVAWSAEHRRQLEALAPRSYMFVPLTARGRTLGTMSFVSTRPGRRYGEADLALAEALAQRAALAVDNARLFRQAQEAIREAQAAARARDAFLARASHELRTPHTTARGTARLLRRARPGQLPESPDALLAVVDRSLTAMAALIEDLLDASKLAAGQETLTRERVDLAEAVGHSLEVVGPQARAKGVAVRVDVPAGLALSADQLKLEQVLVNLLANAVKFTPAGGEVTVGAGREGESIAIRVRDTGEGVVPDQLERIFEPFYQAGGLSDSRATDRRARRVRGTGLGLAICRQIVSLHGGRIWAESEGPGRGSTFVVALPQAGTGSVAA